MKLYTVVLLRGPKFAEDLDHDEPTGTDAYVAYVQAADPLLRGGCRHPRGAEG
jgi:hypothetical protein